MCKLENMQIGKWERVFVNQFQNLDLTGVVLHPEFGSLINFAAARYS